jgi:hypothetical protein
MTIVLKRVNRQTQQIRQLERGKHERRSTNQAQQETIPLAGSQASCDVEQPLHQQAVGRPQNETQPQVDTELRLNQSGF